MRDNVEEAGPAIPRWPIIEFRGRIMGNSVGAGDCDRSYVSLDGTAMLIRVNGGKKH